MGDIASGVGDADVDSGAGGPPTNYREHDSLLCNVLYVEYTVE